MPYHYDVFFSYKRDPRTLDWHRRVKDQLQFWLTQEIGGYEARIFVDEQSIETGDHWPEALQDALLKSKCLVCIWSPEYFQSPWCLSEWKNFCEREALLGLTPHGLIAPIRYHDGDHFPEEARSTQMRDFSRHTSLLPAFWNTDRAVELGDLIREFAREVAQIIERAPEFDPSWPLAPITAKPADKKIGLAQL